MKTTEEMFWEVFAIMQNMAEKFKELAKDRLLPTRDQIVKHVSYSCNVDPDIVLTRTRKEEIAEARQLIHVLFKFGLNLSLSKAGYYGGRFDHATVMNSINRVSDRYNSYPMYRDSVNQMISHLFQSEEIQQHIKARIIDPHLDRKHSYAKLETA